MITVIRDRLMKNKSYKIIIIIIAIVMALSLAIPGVKLGMSGSGWVAKVNGQEISYNDFVRKVQEQEAQLQQVRQQYGAYADQLLQLMGFTDVRVLALEGLVQEELLNQAADAFDFQLSDEFVSQQLSDPHFVSQILSDLIPPFVLDPATGINMQMLKRYLKHTGLSMSDFETKVNQALKRYLLQEIVGLSAYAPLFESREKYKTDFIAKKFSLVTVSPELFVESEKKKPVTDQELQDYFNKHAADYTVSNKYTVHTWKFDATRYGVVVTDQEIEEYYNAHKVSDYLEKPAQLEARVIVLALNNESEEQELYKKAKDIRQELVEKPSLFADKAREFSSDASAKQGGLLPAFSKGSHEQKFDFAAFSLKNDGDISDVVRTNRGFEIIQRVSKKAPVYKSLHTVSNEIKQELMHEKFGEQFAQDMKRIIDDPEFTEKELQSFVTARGGQQKVYEDVEKDTVNDIKLSQAISELKTNGVTFYVEGNAGFAIKMIAIKKGYQPTLDEVKQDVLHNLIQERATVSMKEQLKQVRTQAQSVSLESIADSLNAKIKQVPLVKRSDAQAVKSLAEEGLPVEQMLQMEKQGQVSVVERNGVGYLIKVDEVSPFNEQDFQDKKADIVKSLSQERIQAFVGGFVASLYRNATIKPNESLFNNR
jgi:peptidyl-prolyl cis-trans isomerase D